MFNSVFKIIYLIEFVLITIVRSLGTAKYKREKTEHDQSSTLDTILLAFNGIAMLVPIFYVFSTWFDFADFTLPPWARWIGVVLFGLAAVLLHLTHQAMGRSWTPTLGLRQDHQLVTSGVFKYIRHPMYAAHILWALAQPLILANWIAGFSFLLPQILQFWSRAGDEEKMMLEAFGDQYRDYMESTGRLLPKIGRGSRN